jgi:hypothetical protein
VSNSKGEIFDPHHFTLCINKSDFITLKSQSDFINIK